MDSGQTYFEVLEGERPIAYSDADWASDVNDRKSTSGYIFMISGAAVSWKSKKQTCVALSTAEAEYIALAKYYTGSNWDETTDGRSSEQTS